MRRALARVQDGDLDARVPVYDNTELGQLQASFNTMVEGLRERERIRDLFGRHVGREVAEAAAAHSEKIRLGGEARAGATSRPAPRPRHRDPGAGRRLPSGPSDDQ